MSIIDLKRKRLERSQEIADLVKKGEYLPASINTMESFWPIRKPIEKDKQAIAKLYGEEPKDGQS